MVNEGEMRMDLELKVLTLNCWAIPWISSHRKERIVAIATELASGSYDIAVLQEVWSEDDFTSIAGKCANALPYSHYFHSGVIGAGICVLSKGPIVDVFFQRWPLNGYAHKIHHGDWFGGKGSGLCKVLYKGLRINVYVAHLHAEYNRKYDEYLLHRICQGFELSQFVRATGATCDVNIVAGDLNTELGDLPYAILIRNANLRDSYVECKCKDDSGCTNEHPRNSYTPKSALARNPNGKRIDYIMYNYNEGITVESLSCKTPLDKCPNANFPYSDHEAVVATLQITKTSSAPIMEVNQSKRIKVLTYALEHLESVRFGHMFKKWRHYSMLTFILVLALLFFEMLFGLIPQFLNQTVFALLRLILTLGIGYTVIMLGIVLKSEMKVIKSVVKNLEILLKSCKESYADGVP